MQHNIAINRANTSVMTVKMKAEMYRAFILCLPAWSHVSRNEKKMSSVLKKTFYSYLIDTKKLWLQLIEIKTQELKFLQ